ncbi:MAG: dehydrogenase (ubiquinone) 30 kDa subunit [Bacillales bacterium]|nr:dehydrogenase (ubiquinone) 30 kDa subunit [Bacillales bacterium]
MTESNEKSLAELKREAVQKAKEEASRKKQEQQSESKTELSEEDKLVEEKKRAVAEAKAKAVAEAKAKAAAKASSGDENSDDEKAKAIAEAKAKAVAEAKAKAAEKAAEKVSSGEENTDDEKAKAVAAAKAKAAAVAKAKAEAAAKAKETPESKVDETTPEEPSPNQPLLDKIVSILGKENIKESYINKQSKEVPTIIIKEDAYENAAKLLKENEELSFDYLSSLHATDLGSEFEVYSYLYSSKKNHSVAFKVILDREKASLPSLTKLWEGANWPEREIYDLLGITFINHPNLTRMFLPETWVGYPLRKDYEQFDLEV